MSDNDNTQDLPRAGTLYSPRSAPNNWQPHPGQCRDRVGNGYYSGQCQNSAKFKRDVREGNALSGYKVLLAVEYCGVHDPVRLAAKQAERNRKQQAKWDAKEVTKKKAERAKALRERALAAIRRIAAGHNDPRGLATDILREFEE